MNPQVLAQTYQIIYFGKTNIEITVNIATKTLPELKSQ